MARCATKLRATVTLIRRSLRNNAFRSRFDFPDNNDEVGEWTFKSWIKMIALHRRLGNLEVAVLTPLKATLAVLALSGVLQKPAHAQTPNADTTRHWTLSALGGLSSLSLGGSGAAEVWSRVGPVRGGEALLGAADYGGRNWSVEAAYGQGHGSLAEFTASTLTLSLSVRRRLGFVSTEDWDTRLGVGFVRTGVSLPPIPFARFRIDPSEIVGFPGRPFETSGDELLLANGVRTEVSVVRRSTSRVRLNGRLGVDLSSMQGTTSRSEVPLLTQWGRMTSVYVRFGVAVRL